MFGRSDRPSRRHRRQALDALAVAYADGQLDRVEHEDLMSEVVAAGNLDELRSTLADLQLPADHPVQRLLAPGVRTRRTLDWVLMGVGAVFLVLIGTVVTFALLDDGPEPWPEPIAMMNRPAVEEAFSKPREELGTTEVIAADISESDFRFRLPVDSGAGRYTGWIWDGHRLWQWDTGAMKVARPRVVDLEDVDLTRLFDNIDRAIGMLKGEGDITIRVTVNGGSWPSRLSSGTTDPPRNPPHVQITVETESQGDSVLLITDPSGRKVLERAPSHYDTYADE